MYADSLNNHRSDLARTVLADAETALAMLSENPRGERWRITWVGLVALLRSVDYALAKDRKRSAGIDAAAAEVRYEWGWRTGQGEEPDRHNHGIYWDFIRHERDNVIHGYQFGARQGVDVFPGTDKKARPWYRMITGPYTGRDQRDVVQEAIDWWRRQIEEIEARALSRRLQNRPVSPPPSSGPER